MLVKFPPELLVLKARKSQGLVPGSQAPGRDSHSALNPELIKIRVAPSSPHPSVHVGGLRVPMQTLRVSLRVLGDFLKVKSLSSAVFFSLPSYSVFSHKDCSSASRLALGIRLSP